MDPKSVPRLAGVIADESVTWSESERETRKLLGTNYLHELAQQ